MTQVDPALANPVFQLFLRQSSFHRQSCVGSNNSLLRSYSLANSSISHQCPLTHVDSYFFLMGVPDLTTSRAPLIFAQLTIQAQVAIKYGIPHPVFMVYPIQQLLQTRASCDYNNIRR
jgi:hypothetical protein